MADSNIDIPKSQLSRVFQMVSINNFSLGLISVFIPIYLLKLGHSFQMVMLWFILHHVFILVGSFFSVYISNKIGLVKTLQVRFIFLISHLLLLLALPYYPWLFYLIPILIGIEGAFYWIPLNILLVRNTEKDKMGGAMSKFFAYPKIFSMWSSIIGAMLAIYFGFTTLFIVAVILVVLALIPLLPLSSEKSYFKFSFSHSKEIYKSNKRFFIPEIIDNLAEDAGVIWSIFVYMQLASIVQIGIIGTLTAVATIMFTLTIGRLTDRWNRQKLIRIGAMLVSFMWFLNFLVGQYIPNQWLFYIASIGMALALKVFLVPYSAVLFNRARKDDAQFIVLREIPTIIGRLILYSLALIFYDHLPYVFVIVAIVFMYFWFFDLKKVEDL
jgi:MFS family permease